MKKIAPLIITISLNCINCDRLESVLSVYLCLFKFLQLTAALSSSPLRWACLHPWPLWRWQLPSCSVKQTLCWLTGTYRDFSPNKKVFCKPPVSLMSESSFSPNFAVCSAAPDGKLYDAYVSHLHPSGRSNEAAVFALQILPEKLETQHGYSLYIRGRDDSAGEGLEKGFPLPS